tara:strand:- start:411 stop:1040 length:630 start_codon:yes stop_codon:yes gene_type:complete
MSAHLTDQDCINALATLWYEYHKLPRNESPQAALKRAFVVAEEEVSTKLGYFEQQNDFRLRAESLIKAQQPVYKGLAACRVVYDLLLNENIRSLQARYPDDIKEPLENRIWFNEYDFKKSSTVTKWVSERDSRGLLMVWQMLRGWEYQSCEHYEHRNSVAYQIKQQIEYAILDTLKKVHCPDNENDTVWTSWKDPQLDSHVVCISDMFM